MYQHNRAHAVPVAPFRGLARGDDEVRETMWCNHRLCVDLNRLVKLYVLWTLRQTSLSDITAALACWLVRKQTVSITTVRTKTIKCMGKVRASLRTGARMTASGSTAKCFGGRFGGVVYAAS
jgi:hypothetical protein